jgi:hypothetical protein
MTAKRGAQSAIALVLWLITVGLGLLDIYVVYQVAQVIGLNAGSERRVIEITGYCALLILGLLFVAFVIGTAEYHRKRVGQRRSWRLFTITIVVQVLILLIPLVV